MDGRMLPAWAGILVMLALAWPARGGSTFLPLVKKPDAPLPEVMGLVLEAEKGEMLTAAGEVRPVDRAGAEARRAQRRGLAVIGIGPDLWLRWRLQEVKPEEYFLYFRVRTGHQRGYEYVATMTYFARHNGVEVPLEPVPEWAAVRIYQSAQGWGEDVGWIRSSRPVPLRPGDEVSLGCRESYAYVDKLVLVSQAAGSIQRGLARLDTLQAEVDVARRLLQAIAERLRAFQPIAATATERLAALTAEGEEIRAALQATQPALAAGQTPDVQAPLAALTALQQRWTEEQRRLCTQAAETFRPLARQWEERLAALPPRSPTTYAGREATWAREVATCYLSETRRLLQEAEGTMRWLRRVGTYLCRTQEYGEKARSGLTKAASRPPETGASGKGTLSLHPPPTGPGTRAELCLSGEWEISTRGTPDTPPADGWEPIRVPHGPWREWFGKFGNLDHPWPPQQHWAWYRLRFPVPAEWAGSRLKLRFEAVFHYTAVFVNGQYCGEHYGGFDAFEVDFTGTAAWGQENVLHVFVHDTSKTQLGPNPKEGQPHPAPTSGPNYYVVSDLWGANFGGIWQDVTLCAYPPVHVAEVFVLPSVRKKRLTVRVWVRWDVGSEEGSNPAGPREIQVRNEVLLAGKEVLRLPPQTLRLSPGETRLVETSARWEDPVLWGIGGEYGEPVLCTLRTQLWPSAPSASPPLDTCFTRFGFREFWIEGGQFVLNGRRLPLQGGGTWYLQEGKIANGHRRFARLHYLWEREANVNLQRFHRHGDVARDFFDLADEMGMLCEPEGAYWGCTGVPDLLGEADFSDPVWVRNIEAHYRNWVRKHRNHPSIVLWSIENETLAVGGLPEAMVERFLRFGEVVRQEDPTRPVTYHGSANGGYPLDDPRFAIVNFHYPGADVLRNWPERYGGRPVVNGEFQNYPAYFRSHGPDREVARQALADLCRWIEETFRFYREIDLPGAFYFLPCCVGLFATDAPEHQGPWGDLFAPIETYPEVKEGWFKGGASASVWVKVTWPSLSGRGIKAERLVTGTGFRALINWFNPDRPSATPTPALKALKRAWRPMPPLNRRVAPEVIVQVIGGGRPLPRVAVFLYPEEGQSTPPLGVLSDREGKAWFVLPQPGRYRVRCSGYRGETEHLASWGRADAPPGYADIPLVRLSVATP
ncbi:MAG TPA: hypothetical protein EYP85_07570 [Armatimonadetes bacterium]|nr:hypothetical protein [Armatimonadota bacterium]